MCHTLSGMLGTPLTLDDDKWTLASLPVSKGGLGLRSTEAHSPAAYVASHLLTKPLVQKLLGNVSTERDITGALEMLSTATKVCTTPLDTSKLSGEVTQKTLSLAIDESRKNELLAKPLSDRFKALVSSVGLYGTGAFLNAVPSPALGLRLTNRAFTLALKYRLGCPIYPQDSRCGACSVPADEFGDHAVASCSTGGDKIRRHNIIRNALVQAATSACLSPKLEEPNLLDRSAARPGDFTVNCWLRSAGKPKTAFDVTVTSPLQKSLLVKSAAEPEAALSRARDAKLSKYRDSLPADLDLIPLAVTTFGAWEYDALQNIREIARLHAANKGLVKATTEKFLLQKLSVSLQRENAELWMARDPTYAAASIDGLL